MVPGLGFGEFIVLAVLALVVVGPRELPKLMRHVGGFMRKVREMGREFQRSFDDLGRELELEELRKEINAIKRGDIGPMNEISAELADMEREARHGPTPRPQSSGAAENDHSSSTHAHDEDEQRPEPETIAAKGGG